MCHWFLFFANGGFAFEAVVFSCPKIPLWFWWYQMQLAPGAGPRTPVYACVRLHMEGPGERSTPASRKSPACINIELFIVILCLFYVLTSYFCCKYWCQRWRWKAHHLRLELARAEQAWTTCNKHSVCSRHCPLKFLLLNPSVHVGIRHGIRDGEHIARQQWMCRVTSPLPDPLEKTRRLGRSTDVRSVMCGWLMPNSLTRYE